VADFVDMGEHDVGQKVPAGKEQRGTAEDGDGRGRSGMTRGVVDDQGVTH
jgi:hypothetical protein